MQRNESEIDDRWENARMDMVERQIRARGIQDEKVLHALKKVPRHLLVPEQYRDHSYEDRPLPIGFDQTISQPYIVALMTEMLELEGNEKVLEVGLGSGYQAAVLAEIVPDVYGIEIVAPLCKRTQEILQNIGYQNRIQIMCGDGYQGWEEHAPFDAILVAAAPDHIPPALKEQLKIGGRLVLPVGDRQQSLVRIRRTETGFKTEPGIPVRFVPMTGEAEKDLPR